jgi:hypothetical protein
MGNGSRDELDASYARTANRVNDLEEMRVGPTLVSGIARLQAEPCDAPTAVRVHALWAKVIAWAQSQQMIATHDALYGIGYLADLDGVEQVRVIAQELATATATSLASAIDYVSLTLDVAQNLPASWVALERGQLSLAHIKALAFATAHVGPRLTSAVDAEVIPLAVQRRWTPSHLMRQARRVLIAIDPDGAAERAAAAKADADVRFFAEPDEIATMIAQGDAATVRRVFDSINDRAVGLRREGDTRTAGQRRIAALAEAVLGAPAEIGENDATATERSSRQRRAAQAVITVDLSTYLGLNEQPGELSGYGPITADTARQIADNAALRRLVTDPLTGRGLDLGRTQYEPSTPLRRFVQARDRTCRFPGCSRPAMGSDIDHVTEWNRDGLTNPDNLHVLCRTHHNLKTKKLWRVTVGNDGTEVWTSPLGFVYTNFPDGPPVSDPDPPPGRGSSYVDPSRDRQSHDAPVGDRHCSAVIA